MNLVSSAKLAIGQIWSAKVRSFLTMLGVIIGVASLVALTSIANGATSGITESLGSLGANKITVSSQQPKALSEADAESISKLPNVLQVGVQSSGKTTLSYGRQQVEVSIAGVSGEYTEMNNPDLLAGSFLTDVPNLQGVNQVVINEDAAEELKLSGKQIGSEITLFGRPFILVGITKSAAAFNGGGQAYVSLENARNLFAQYPFVTTIEVEAQDSESVADVEASVTDFLLSKYQVAEEEATFSIQNQASFQETIGSITSTLSLLLGGIASISLVVGGIGIMNIMLVSVRERTREIGIRRAIGATQSQVLIQFLIEAIVLSIIGGVLGLAVGEALAFLIAQIGGWAFSVDFATVGLALGFSVIVGVLFGVWPARSAARLLPVEALRYE